MPSPLIPKSRSKTADLWSQWQPGKPTADDGKDGSRGKPQRGVSLGDYDPGAKPFSLGGKAQDKAAVDALAAELDTLQDLFYADKRYKLLVVLQGTDTSGKDGTIRGVFGRMSALGVHAVGWKAPTEAERARDYLWRIHQQVPQAGDITVFNRSQYEDVLVPVVNGWITPEQHQQRLAHINDFERMLSETGTVVLKFLLHISADEQKQRLQERLDDPAKHWKFSQGDIEVRKQWAEYQNAYDTLLSATHTPWAPWTIVPANSKTHRNLMIATVLREVLQNLDLRYPEGDPALAQLKVE
ncbi:PPK2 family polyphosphate kinase [Acidovorax sp. Leaf78]|uniref:PPK2 family polyphosphate kinase n=1 Tax=Acidovorax sp. Leaf78 TaxID=1736237 RepID=UPI0006F84891|nr:PPK2 family polyphosphate kinase [Acidovorax sp. Leaf78]KQO26030.1 phosphate--nucleotide phosphotransferase [Acidovorax sp. Leaf78]